MRRSSALLLALAVGCQPTPLPPRALFDASATGSDAGAVGAAEPGPHPDLAAPFDVVAPPPDGGERPDATTVTDVVDGANTADRPIAPDALDAAVASDGPAPGDTNSAFDSGDRADLPPPADLAAPLDLPASDRPSAADLVAPRDVWDVPSAQDVGAPNDAGDGAAHRDAADVSDVGASVDLPRANDGAVTGAWERIGDFDNGLWQFGHFLAATADGTLYLARSREGVYRGVVRSGRYVFELLTTAGLTNLSFSALGVNARGEPLLGCFGMNYGGTGPGSVFRYNPATDRWTASSVPSPGYTRNVSDFYTAPDGAVFATGGWSALVLRSTDGGDRFEIRANLDAQRPGVRYGLLFSIEVGPRDEMFVGSETESFQHSFDEGRSFTPVDTATWLQRGNPYGVGFTAAGDALFSRAIDADPTKIYRRDPLGGWVRADTGLAADPINTAPIYNWINTIILAPWGENFIATATTVYRARDGGPWTPFVDGIDPAFYPWPNTIATDGRCVFLALRPVSPRSDAGQMYRYCGR